MSAGLACAEIHATFREVGVDFFTGVPDSVLKHYCGYVADCEDSERHAIAANEGGALALAAGHHLATGGLSLVYLQNSGLGNLVNPALSLATPDVYGIPMLLLIGWRGQPGVADEPQHRFQGAATTALLDDMNIEHTTLPGDLEAAREAIRRAAGRAREVSGPYAILVEKGRFAPHATAAPRPRYSMTREEALRETVAHIGADDLVVSTTGHVSRELSELRAAAGTAPGHDFLNVGAMGHASQVALGIALAQPDPNRRIFCLDGDGAILMHLGAMAVVGTRAPKTFRHIVLNNGAHDSVGGQPTAGFDVDLTAIADACGYRSATRVTSQAELANALSAFVVAPGPAFLEIRVDRGARADLGRPSTSPAESKRAFMQRIKK